MGKANFDIALIEREVRETRALGNPTEQWMNAKARHAMNRMGEREDNMRYAFEAGYRHGAESRMTLWAVLVLVFISIELARYLVG